MKRATEMTDLRVCENCGIEFRGSSVTRYCPECRELRKAHKLELEPEQRKDGWRHMYRNSTGTVMRVGANVMTALDDLCAYEEALEAAGVRGPEELGMLLRFESEEKNDRSSMRIVYMGRDDEGKNEVDAVGYGVGERVIVPCDIGGVLGVHAGCPKPPGIVIRSMRDCLPQIIVHLKRFLN